MWPHAVRCGLTVRATDHNRELTYGYFPRGSFDSSRSVAFAMSYTYAYYDSRYNQFGSWRGLPSARRASSRSIVTDCTWLRIGPTLKLPSRKLPRRAGRCEIEHDSYKDSIKGRKGEKDILYPYENWTKDLRIYCYLISIFCMHLNICYLYFYFYVLLYR